MNQQAEAFLRHFDGIHTFQSFDDKGKDASLARHNSAQFEEIESKLLELNSRGAGIFFTVNETDGKGRKAENITRVRAIFVDLDGDDAREKLSRVMSAAVPPSIVIESSPAKFHCYWLCFDCSKEQFPAVQKALAGKFQGDPAVNDLARVMRLPGFYHNKSTPFSTRVVESDGQEYSISQLIEGLGLELNRQDNPPVEHKVNGFPAGERNESMFKYAASLRARGVAIEEAQVLMKAQANLCKPAMEYREMMKCLAQAYKYPEGKSEEFEGKRKKTPEATREDYYKLTRDVLGEIRRDIFSGSAMYRDSEGWQRIKSGLSLIRAEAVEREIGKVMRYRREACTDFVSELENSLTPETLFDCPEWDGVDRLAAIARCIHLDGTQENFCQTTVYEYLRYWCSNVWRKIYLPQSRGLMLILKAKQYAGKDWLIDTLVGGFEQWQKHLNIYHQDKDNFLQLSSAAVLRIPELDKLTNKVDVATVKDMITRAETDIRAAYDADSKRRLCRASFIASVNSDDIYKDSTGNTRYAVFNISKIDFDYPRSAEDQKQIIAQGRALYLEDFQLSNYEQKAMAEFLNIKTPTSDAEFILQNWNEVIGERFKPGNTIKTRGWITNTEATNMELYQELTKLTGYKLKSIQGVLKSKGMGVFERLDKKPQRGYRISTDVTEIVTDAGPKKVNKVELVSL